MTFHEQSFQSRFGTMGDPAEARFDEVDPKNHKLGLNRPPFSMAGMDPMLRYLPDRMTRDRFVECMGIGRDETLKLKIEKIGALLCWQAINDVDLFVSHTDGRAWQAPIEAWLEACIESGHADTFHDGKKYVALHSDWFPEHSQIEVSFNEAA